MLLFVDAKQTFDLIYIAQYASLYTLVSNQVYHIRVTFFSHVCKNTCKLWVHFIYDHITSRKYRSKTGGLPYKELLLRDFKLQIYCFIFYKP